MSELVSSRSNQGEFRWHLLTTVSALALVGNICVAQRAEADGDADRPSVWIELGGQLSRLGDAQEVFSPMIMADRPSVFSPSQPFEKLPRYNIDEFGKISISPLGHHWVFSAAIHYGRSSTKENVHQQTHPNPFYKYHYYSGVDHKITAHPQAARFADTKAHTSDDHLVLDFQVGRDVGLGLFGGRDGSSVLNFGVRFAQFHSKADMSVRSNPDRHFVYTYIPFLLAIGFASSKIPEGSAFHSNFAELRSARGFHGVGPSLSWNASAPVANNSDGGEFVLDWGINAAVLFGRQRAEVAHQASGSYQRHYMTSKVVTYHPNPVQTTRSRSVVVPNLGGFAAFSFRYPDAKISFGYRADFFIGAMDGGIDSRRTYDSNFYGPFATIGIGFP